MALNRNLLEMNFSPVIHALDQLIVVQIPAEDPDALPIYAYIDWENPISHNLYPVYEIDSETHQINPEKKFAVKKLEKNHAVNSKTAAIFNQHHQASYPVLETEDSDLLFQKYLPGEIFIDDDCKITNQALLHTLSFTDLTKLFLKMGESIHHLHRDGIMHLDIKPSHLITEFKRNYKNEITGINKVHLCGFRFAEHGKDDVDGMRRIETHCSPFYAPPEICRDLRGGKGDFLALVPIILTCLGATDPFKNKKKHWQSDGEKSGYTSTSFFHQRYDFSGLFQDRPYPDYLTDEIKTYLIAFLNRMQRKDYLNRIDGEAYLQFFSLLHNYACAAEENENHPELLRYRTAMNALASGLCYFGTDPEEIAYYEKLSEFDYAIKKQPDALFKHTGREIFNTIQTAHRNINASAVSGLTQALTVAKTAISKPEKKDWEECTSLSQRIKNHPNFISSIIEGLGICFLGLALIAASIATAVITSCASLYFSAAGCVVGAQLIASGISHMRHAAAATPRITSGFFAYQDVGTAFERLTPPNNKKPLMHY